MKTVNVGINGFGRIGKVLFRILVDNPKIDLVAINDPMEKQMLMHLLKYDTVHGKFAHESKLVNGDLLINGKTIKFGHWNNPSEIPWSSWGVDTVVESSGLFTKREGLQKHIDAGAKRVILSCPPDDEVDFIALMGVNHHKLTSNHRIISNASCTANSVAPILQILNKEFGVETAFLNTVHPYTNNQRIMDSPHSDYRRARASGANIIPTSTSAIRAIHTAMPEFKDRFHGISTRVPIPCGALSELVITFKSQVTATTINKAIEKYAKTSMKGIIDYCTDPIVSSDVVGSPFSSIFDSLATTVINENTAQIICWYDNEWGYSNRLVDLILTLKAL